MTNTAVRPNGFFSNFFKLKEARREAKLRQQRERYHEEKDDPVYAEARRETVKRYLSKKKVTQHES